MNSLHERPILPLPMVLSQYLLVDTANMPIRLTQGAEYLFRVRYPNVLRAHV